MNGPPRVFSDVYGFAQQALQRMEEHEVPPSPSAYSVWYAYAARANRTLVSKLDDLLADGARLGPYEMEELFREFLREPDLSEAKHKVGATIEQEISGALALMEKSISNSDAFRLTLDDVQKDLPGTASPDRLAGFVSRLVDENRKMAEKAAELNEGLRLSQKQIETLNHELAEIHASSMRDPLTDVANRRAFDDRLQADMDAALKSGAELCLAMADIDHFKGVNDRFGHVIGDAVLKLFASLMRQNTKGRDLVARYGGEEFALILPHTDLEAATGLIETIRAQMEASQLKIKKTGERIGSVTASFGLAAFEPGETMQTFIERADRQLYRAKQTGRNCVRVEMPEVG